MLCCCLSLCLANKTEEQHTPAAAAVDINMYRHTPKMSGDMSIQAVCSIPKPTYTIAVFWCHSRGMSRQTSFPSWAKNSASQVLVRRERSANVRKIGRHTYTYNCESRVATLPSGVFPCHAKSCMDNRGSSAIVDIDYCTECGHRSSEI